MPSLRAPGRRPLLRLAARVLILSLRYTRVAVADLVQVLERSHPREREWARRGTKGVKST